MSLISTTPRTGVLRINVSHLHSTWKATMQRQAAVKLYGVFACGLKVLDCAPVKSISPDISRGQWSPRWTIHASRQLPTRYYATLRGHSYPRLLVLRQVETRFQIPALSRIQGLYTTFRSGSPMFLLNSRSSLSLRPAYS